MSHLLFISHLFSSPFTAGLFFPHSNNALSFLFHTIQSFSSKFFFHFPLDAARNSKRLALDFIWRSADKANSICIQLNKTNIIIFTLSKSLGEIYLIKCDVCVRLFALFTLSQKVHSTSLAQTSITFTVFFFH